MAVEMTGRKRRCGVAQTKELRRTVMENHEGSSNKDYAIWIEPKGDGFVVPFLFGPIGGTKQAGCKTPKPVSMEEAEKVLGKIVKEKLG